MQKSLDYLHSNREMFLEQLKEFLKIPSVSMLSVHKADMIRAAEWLAGDMRRIGIENVEIYPTNGHPVVYGDWLHAGEDAPTVLVYGHYDVQPVDPLDLWETPPFEPSVRNGELYARGASDDKGQMFAHVKAVETMLAAESALPVNVKLLFEGEEEIGSPNFDPFVIDHKHMLAADTSLVSDGRILSPDLPSLVYGLRGLCYMEINVHGPSRDLHSGSYGGSIHNPAQVAAEIIATLHDSDGKVLIPGFYDKVRALTEVERAALAEVPYTLEGWRAETGLVEPWGEPDYTLLERVSARPTCEVNGIWGGFQGEGTKTVIPATAGAKISMRLVPDQDPHEIAELFKQHIASVTPPGVRVDVIKYNAGFPAITPIDSPEMQAAARAYEAGWGRAPVFTREGGSIPIVTTFQNELGAPAVLMGFGLDDNVHSPNEHFRVSHFYRGIETIIHYYHNLANG